MIDHSALIHEETDDVAIAIVDLNAGVDIKVKTMDGVEVGTIKIIDDIPLGHKISMREIEEGNEVIEYGHTIGKAVKTIPKGAYVHTHNIVSIRWTQ